VDAALLLIALAGAACGAIASALPGVQVNAVALLVLALAPAGGERAAAFLVGAMAGAPFGRALGATLVGDSDLPAHRLAREGRAAEAIARLCWGAFAGLALAVPLGLALRSVL
jgi:TctA family transporter